MKASKSPDMVTLFGRMKKFSFRQFSSYMETYAYESFMMGLREGEEEGITWDSEDLYALMLSEGVESRTAARIVERMLTEDGFKHEGDTEAGGE